MLSSSSLRASSAAFLASRSAVCSSAWRQLTSRATISTTTKKAWTATRPRVSGSVCVPFAEDLVGGDDADHRVVEDDEADRQRERQPVEVEPDGGEHREEEEVRLDRAVGQVHEHGRAGHQAERRDARAAAAREPARAGQQRRDHERREVDDHVGDRAPGQQPVGGERRHVEPEDRDDAAVAALPQLVREAGEPRQGIGERAHAHARVVGQCARVLSPGRRLA